MLLGGGVTVSGSPGPSNLTLLNATQVTLGKLLNLASSVMRRMFLPPPNPVVEVVFGGGVIETSLCLEEVRRVVPL